jgi:hypothetical protein
MGLLPEPAGIQDDHPAAHRWITGVHCVAGARATLTTVVEIVDADSTLVCRGSFDWKLRRQPT